LDKHCFKLILTYNYWQDRYEVDGYENIPLSNYMINMTKLAIMFSMLLLFVFSTVLISP